MKILNKDYSLAGLALLLLTVISFAGLTGCGQSISVVDAGTYNGTIDKVVPEESEIYVTLDKGEQLELYFNEDTELLRGGTAVDFSALSQGASVEITVGREGNRNIPLKVIILQ